MNQIENRIEFSAKCLSDELQDFSQRCRVGRWWLDNFPTRRVTLTGACMLLDMGEKWTKLNWDFGVLDHEVELEEESHATSDVEEVATAGEAAEVHEWKLRQGKEPERWDYGPYRVARVTDGSWGIFRSDMMLDLGTDLETVKRLVERLHAVESEGAMIIGEYGAPLLLELFHEGKTVCTMPDLASLLDLAEQHLYEIKRRLRL